MTIYQDASNLTKAEQQKLRSNLHTKALNELKRKFPIEYYAIYNEMLKEYGLEPRRNPNSIVIMAEEINRLKKLVGEL